MRLLNVSSARTKPAAWAVYIGVNRVAETHYGLDVEELYSCINDAEILKATATEFIPISDSSASPGVFANGAAKLEDVTAAIRSAVTKAAAGEFVLITFSGHGFSVDLGDLGEHAAWCLSDFPLFDTHLHSLLSESKNSGVRILVISDSCASGGVALPPRPSIPAQLADFAFGDSGTRRLGLGPVKALPYGMVDVLVSEHRNAYRATIEKYRDKVLTASVVHMAACGEDEVTYAGPTGRDLSIFTANVVAVWNGGQGASDFSTFEGELQKLAPRGITPEIEKLVPEDAAFNDLGPFRLS